MSFPRYPAYKEGEDPMIGLVPEHWKKAALKHLADYQNGYPFKPDDWGDTGRPIIRIAQLTGDAEPDRYVGLVDERVAVYEGDLLFSWSATLDSFFWRGEPAWLNQHIFKVTPSKQCIKEYLYYLIKFWAPKLADVDAHGSTMRHIKKESLGQRLFVPPLDEQRSISEFLDHETAKIDALVTEQERLIELLKEKRQAVISHAVTKGLDPSVPMKDSGVEWLGEVPVHWNVTRLKFVAHVQTGIAKGKDTTGKSTITVPYLRVANVQDGYLALDEVALIDIEADQLDRYRLLPGDVLMNEGGDFDKLGRGAIWNGEIHDCIHQNHVFAVRPHGVSADWLNCVTSSQYAQFYFMGRSKQSTNLASISSSNIMELPVVLPPAKEQVSVQAFIKRETEKLDTLKATSEGAIALLQERRTALISAAVTGQIDVRGWTPPTDAP